IFFLTNHSSSPEESGEGKAERSPSPALGKLRVTLFSPRGKDVAGPRSLRSSASPLLRFSACSLCGAGGGVWQACRPLRDHEPQRRNRNADGWQQGGVTACPHVVDAVVGAAFCGLGGVTPTTALGLSGEELDASAQLRGASRPQRDAWLEDLSHSLL
ncbi:unnamed protein product, partial [Rangifer tarandus platyrhynchus]